MSALVLVAHGSRDPNAASALQQLTRAVEARVGSRAVLAYLDHGAPDVPTALEQAGEGCVVVPLLLADGYHSRVDLPALVAAAPFAAAVSPVLGPDELLVDAVDHRLREAGCWPGETAVVLAAAGSSGPAAAPATEWTADRLATRGWNVVRPAYLSARTPAVPDAVAALRAEGHRVVAVASYLLAPGRFQSALDAAGADLVTGPLGAAPAVVELVLRRARQARVPSLR